MELAQEFDVAMFELYKRAKVEANYSATLFLQMLTTKKGVATAKQLINATKPSEGYTHLYERGFLNLTVEALVVEDRKWHSLFLPEELARARKRLNDYEYEEREPSAR